MRTPLGKSLMFSSQDMATSKLKNVHRGVAAPGLPQHVSLVKGDYEYWHYCCDGTNDRGWGCGYRTLQTVCSWVKLQRLHSSPTLPANNSVPHDVVDRSAVDVSTDNVISVIGSGDINDVSSAYAGASAHVTEDASENDGRTLNSKASSSCKFESENGCDEDNTNEIVVLSSGNTHSLESETFEHVEPAVRLQDVLKHDGSNITVLSSGNQNKKQGSSLQSLAETVKKSEESKLGTNMVRDVPSLLEIQKALVHMGDKHDHFVGSRQWIGSYEVCLCLDFFYGVPCKIVHVNSGAGLKQHLSTLHNHFSSLGSPVMMGGDTDASSKGIVGVCLDPGALLVVDPHYCGKADNATSLQTAGWIKWVPLQDFCPRSFYNMCLPQLAAVAL
ncbi:ufm1-specific protease 1-like isoform X2 [Babylonia areolata]|uniref:ufm1-specific protease 1-like isoform X2 n=1 Tax=Babylonia areolata TaxID=304850 RepID=UPI003FD4861C